MAASATALTALSLPRTTRARVTAEAVEKLVGAASGGSLYDQLVCGLSFKVTKAFNEDPGASLLLYTALTYEALSLGTHGLTFTPLSALQSALGDNPRVADVIPGANPNEVTLAELFARLLAPGIAMRTGPTLRGDVAALLDAYRLPDRISDILDNGFRLETVLEADGGVSHDSDLMQFFVDPENYVINKILDSTPVGDLTLTLRVPPPVDRSETFSMRDTADQFEDKVLDLIAGGDALLDKLFDSPEFRQAKEFVLALGNRGLDGLNSVIAVGSNLIGTPLGGIDLPDIIGTNIFSAVQSPSAAARALQDQVRAAQERLDDVLGYVEGLYSRFMSLPEDVVSHVPGLGYVVSEAAGAFESIAHALINEIHRAEQLAQDLTGQIMALESQLQSLVLSAADLPFVHDAIGAVQGTLSDPLGSVVDAVSTFQQHVPGLAQIPPEAFKATLNAAVGDLNRLMDENKDLLGGALGIAAFSALKSNAIFMVLSREQIKAILKYGLQIEPQGLAIIEAIKLYGRWNGHTPLDDLNKLSLAQLNKRVNDKIAPVVNLLRAVRGALRATLDVLEGAIYLESISKVLSHNLFNANSAYQRRLSVYGATPATRVADLVNRPDYQDVLRTPITAPTYSRDVAVTFIAVELAELLIEHAKEEPLLAATLGQAHPFELATESLHRVVCDMAREALRQALVEVVTNYFMTLIQNAFTSIDVDLGPYEDLDQRMLEEEKDAARTDRAIVLGARIALDVASVGIADLVGAAVFVVFAQEIRSVIEQQVGAIFDIVL